MFKELKELEILQNALDFSNTKVRDCMVPRTEIEGINIDDSIINLRKQFINFAFFIFLIK